MIVYKKVPRPYKESVEPVMLSDATMEERKSKILAGMKKEGIDSLVIYADLEHGSNFEYLVGFLPRFEEALLVLHQDGNAQLVLGNENLNKADKSRIVAEAVHLPHFSLPNQPMKTTKTVKEILAQCGLQNDKKIGIVGWKNFTSHLEDNSQLFDLPMFLYQPLRTLCENTQFVNATYLFIGENGARTTNNANEFAHYEFGAALAGNCMLEAMDALELGKTEMEIADHLDAAGQRHCVVTIMASGPRFVKANLYPTDHKITKGETLSLTTGYKGGLQSRAGYAVSCVEELPKEVQDYLDVVAKPYFQAVATWLEQIHIGMQGKELYDAIETVLPKEKYGWSLNPGHLCADEEWLSSPIYPESKEILQSGMLFQIDIIPSVKGYGGISCESGILLADENLRRAIKKEYPSLWQHIQKRRDYIQNNLGIQISQEILPTSSMTAYCAPLMLNKEEAMVQI